MFDKAAPIPFGTNGAARKGESMSYEFRMPNVSGRTGEEQVRQLLSYLRQHIQELNFVMRDLNRQGLTEKQRQEVEEIVKAEKG